MSVPAPIQPTAVIIGASSGIGLSTARALARRGYRLVLASRSESRLAAAATACQSDGAAQIVAHPADVRDSESVASLFERAISEFGRIDVVVHTATVMAYGAVTELPETIFTGVVDTAIHGTFRVARASMSQFRAQGSGTLIIVNSLLGDIVAPEMGAYAVAKHGQSALIRALQIEARKERHIHICAVAPGGVNTPIYAQAANVTGREARPPIPVDPPEKIADAILRRVDRPRSRTSAGITNPLVRLGYRTLPWVYDAAVTPLLHVASLTKGTAPPTDGNVVEPAAGGEAEHGPWTYRWHPRKTSNSR